MDTQPAFGFKELLTHIVGDMAKAMCERNGETKQQEFSRSQAAAHTIMGFLPRDAIEAMLAGHCVMFHEMMVDSVRDTLRGEMDTMRRATRSSIVAMDKRFGNNLARLERFQKRPSEGRRDAPVADEVSIKAQGEESVERAEVKPTASAPTRPVQTPEAAVEPQREVLPPRVAETSAIFTPSPDAIAACRANPEAMAALDAGDSARFARALGIDVPNEAYLAAASIQGSPFDRRLSGTKRPVLAASPQAHRSDGFAADGRRIVSVARDVKGKSAAG